MKKRLVILGAGESGVGTAILAKKMEWEVFVSDYGNIKPHFKQELVDNQIEFEEKAHTEEKILNAQLVMKSPGIADKVSIVKKIKEQQIQIVSEIEFAYQYSKSTIIGITGSNGKTTTTALTYHLLKNGGLSVAVGGNIGKSFARIVAEAHYDYVVLELSSFQLDDIKNFKPHVAVLTNITPDHLDRYNYSVDEYATSKLRICMNQNPDDFFIWCADDELSIQQIETTKINSKQLRFSLHHEAMDGAYVHNHQIIFQNHKQTFTMSINELGLAGKHNTYNSMAAGIVARLFELRKESIRESLHNFEALEHRLEKVSKVRGVEFINDSKATNVNSTWFALESMTNPVIWIAGGVDKGNDYEVLVPLVKKKVKALICLGKDNIALHSAFAKCVDVIINTEDMNDAVAMSLQLADRGDSVLLSPACASFDLFENYEDRGKKFKAAVRNL